MRALITAASLGLAVLAGPGLARAELILGLTDQNRLVSFDSNSPGTVSAPVAITGLTGGDRLLDIDVRPANGQLYSISQTGRLYTINPLTGAATPGALLSTALSGSAFGIDFNPVADRLRIVSNTGQNLRVNVDTGAATVDGALAFSTAAGEPNAGSTPQVIGAAYTNSFAGAASTTLYDLDAAGFLLVQNPPNNGTLTTVGATDFVPFSGAFDISGRTGNAYATPDGFTLFQLNLATGGTTSFAATGTQQYLVGLTVAAVPEPGAVAMGLTGIACMGGLVGGLRRRMLVV